MAAHARVAARRAVGLLARVPVAQERRSIGARNRRRRIARLRRHRRPRTSRDDDDLRRSHHTDHRDPVERRGTARINEPTALPHHAAASHAPDRPEPDGFLPFCPAVSWCEPETSCEGLTLRVRRVNAREYSVGRRRRFEIEDRLARNRAEMATLRSLSQCTNQVVALWRTGKPRALEEPDDANRHAILLYDMDARVRMLGKRYFADGALDLFTRIEFVNERAVAVA